MFIVLLEKEEISKSVINVMFGKDIEIARDWVYNYLIKYIDTLDHNKNTLGYKIKENLGNNSYDLIYEYKKIETGYIYNSSKVKFKTIMTVTILEYNDIQFNKKKFLDQYHKILIKRGEKEFHQKQESKIDKEKKD